MKTQLNFAVACIGLVSHVMSSAITWEITENGYPRSMQVHYQDEAAGGAPLIDGTGLEYGAGTRMYLTNSEGEIYKPNLLGGVIEYDIDLSQADCGCVSQIHSVLLPDSVSSVDDAFG